MKQVIVMRDDLNMRKGKMIAQGAHAAMMFMIHTDPTPEVEAIVNSWIEGGMTKVCVRCSSELELDEIFVKSKDAGLLTEIIVDAGRTEFGGVPTKTCLAIGPGEIDKIDQITGNLELL
jgi:peptidyl-tRNA hydrolase, PTH2 family